MNIFKLNQLLKAQVIVVPYFIICYLFMSENVSSQKKWPRDNLQIKYNWSERAFIINCFFIDYEFGLWGEHAYLEWINFEYSKDGKHFEKLFDCEVKDQIRGDTSIVYLKNKLPNAKIRIIKDVYDLTTPYLIWEENTNIHQGFANIHYYGRFYLTKVSHPL